MAIWQGNYVLNEESIDKVSYKVYKLLQEKKYPEESLISSRLSLETILLRWLENGGTGKTFEVEAKKSFGRLHIYLRLEGDCIADAAQKMDLEYFDRVQEALGATVATKYIDGTNIADIKLPRVPISSIHQIAIALVLAVVLGYILPLIFAPQELQGFSKVYLTPAYKTIIGILSGFAIFQILFSILDTVVNMGSLAVLKKMGTKYLQLSGSVITISAIIGMVLLATVFPILSTGGAGGDSSMAVIYKLLLDMIPTNLVVPFTQGNLLQVVFLAFFLGICLLILGSEITLINQAVHEANKLLQFAVASISKLMPLFIFLSFLALLLNGQLKLVLGFWKMILAFYGGAVLVSVVILIFTAFYTKNSMTKIFKEAIHPFIMGFTTCSSLACCPTVAKALTSLGVKEVNSKFNINAGLIFSKSSCMLYLTTIVVYSCCILEKSLGIGECAILAFTTIVLSIAVPSLPGGTAAIVSNLMLQYSLPMELVGAVLSIDFIMDMMRTGVRGFFMVCEGLIFDKIVD